MCTRLVNRKSIQIKMPDAKNYNKPFFKGYFDFFYAIFHVGVCWFQKTYIFLYIKKAWADFSAKNANIFWRAPLIDNVIVTKVYSYRHHHLAAGT